MATAQDRVLLTEDNDFGDLAFFYGNRSSGIVLLRARLGGAGPGAAKAGAVAEVLEEDEGELTGDPLHFVVV